MNLTFGDQYVQFVSQRYPKVYISPKFPYKESNFSVWKSNLNLGQQDENMNSLNVLANGQQFGILIRFNVSFAEAWRDRSISPIKDANKNDQVKQDITIFLSKIINNSI